MKQTVYVVCSIDVEEEGLFGGTYARDGLSLRNVAELVRLRPLLERHIPITLLCTQSVFADSAACHVLEQMRDAYGAEIGAHLHHWNTPPLYPAPFSGRKGVLTRYLPQHLAREKLSVLLEAGRVFQGASLHSFRMGRWDLGREMWPLLAEQGILTDASVRPLHCGYGMPDHFAAQADPYRVPVGTKEIFEVPLTCVPLCRSLPKYIRFWARGKEAEKIPAASINAIQNKEGADAVMPMRGKVSSFAASIQKWGALMVLPVYHPLWFMRFATQRHLSRGGKVLSLTWHSSEMLPGGAPHMPDEAAVSSLLRKMCAYVDWLESFCYVRPVTMDTLRQTLGATAPLQILPDTEGDWTTGVNDAT